MAHLISEFSSWEKRLDALVAAGRAKKIKCYRPGAWSYYALDDLGLDAMCFIMRDCVDEFILRKESRILDELYLNAEIMAEGIYGAPEW